MFDEGALVFQQKASAFPAIALDPPKGAQVIDACAATSVKEFHIVKSSNCWCPTLVWLRLFQILPKLRHLAQRRLNWLWPGDVMRVMGVMEGYVTVTWCMMMHFTLLHCFAFFNRLPWPRWECVSCSGNDGQRRANFCFWQGRPALEDNDDPNETETCHLRGGLREGADWSVLKLLTYPID